MACTNCSTSSGSPKGCKNNGTCGTDSCNKLTVFDWLSNMSLPGGQEPFDCVEVRFKNGRKEFFKNAEKLSLSIGDIVATEANPGHDVGIITLTGELVKVQMKKKGVDYTTETPKIYRKASQKDIDIWQEARNREQGIQVRARELAIALNLEMKISDIEFQGDGSKATFYYTASDRVDFRQLIKDYAAEFKIRIEMKQVGFRQEAARLGGVGSCGRELCCSTWLTDFRSVNTSAARYQQLSLNPQKLAGQCGKLKCCLNYELDTYMDALKDFPDMETKLLTDRGEATCQKIDIFKELMWFAYPDNMAIWHMLKVSEVKEILDLNKEGKKIATLEDFVYEEEKETVEKTFQNAMGQDSLTRFDQPKKKNKKKKTNSTTISNEKPIENKTEKIIKPRFEQNKLKPEHKHKPKPKPKPEAIKPKLEERKLKQEGGTKSKPEVANSKEDHNKNNQTEGQRPRNNRPRPRNNRSKNRNDKKDDQN
ncbi:stage 0 sporulation family protein [Flavobacterium davisii]|uniref:PSP1 domain-containing protein n=1 Tax=Flavobacterium davisii TaxID=2906077 RepID=UPI0035CF31B9